jgi:hypothetical protein
MKMQFCESANKFNLIAEAGSERERERDPVIEIANHLSAKLIAMMQILHELLEQLNYDVFCKSYLHKGKCPHHN